MKPEHKRYILENINKKSIKKLSQELGLKEKKIRKFLESEKDNKKQPTYQKDTKAHLNKKIACGNELKQFPCGIRCSLLYRKWYLLYTFLYHKKTVLLSCLLIAVLGFAVYANSLNGEFLWDDEVLIKDNIYIKSYSRMADVFTKDIGAGGGRRFNAYRPLQMLTYMINYSLGNLNVLGYHLGNVLLHILVALLIFWLINILYDNWLLSLFTSLFFIVHPVHTEAVAYISGRADSLVAIFMLLCFIFYIKELHAKSMPYYVLMLASYILALLSRENALILPVILLLYHYSFKERPNSKQFLPIASFAFIYIILRFTLLKSLLSSLSRATTLLQRLPGFFVALINYIRLIFLPFNLHMEYGKRLFSFAQPQVILGILILIALFVYIAKERKTKSLIFFSLSWFFIMLLPSSNLYPINAYMAEHWLYLPSIGIFLLLATGLNFLYKTKQSKVPTVVLTISLLAFYSNFTTRQNSYWNNPITFYERTIKYAPGSVRMHNNLAFAYYSRGQNEKAISLYKKAIQLNPDYAEAYNNLGNVYRNLGQNEEAITLYKKAIEIRFAYAEAYNNLAFAYHNLGRDDEAIVLLKKAIQINPDYAMAYYNLGNAYRDLGKDKQAISLYKKAIQLNPDYAEAYHNLSVSYFHNKQYKLAIKYCDKARDLGFVNHAFLKTLKPYRENK